MGLMANRAATRMQTRQMYRTASRMQRRRSSMEARTDQRQDFEPAPDPGATPQQAAPAAEPSYVAELEQLARLRDQGLVTSEEFDAKKRQLLGI